MKRHEALTPLSREHHKALILARLLRKDAPAYKQLPTQPLHKADYAMRLFQTSLKQHFHHEEVMLEKVGGFNVEIGRLCNEVLREHRELTKMFSAIRIDEDIVDQLDILGRTLERHIRKEERIFFPLIQQYCPEELLEEIRLLLN